MPARAEFLLDLPRAKATGALYGEIGTSRPQCTGRGSPAAYLSATASSPFLLGGGEKKPESMGYGSCPFTEDSAFPKKRALVQFAIEALDQSKCKWLKNAMSIQPP
jgi:hypothetical protein